MSSRGQSQDGCQCRIWKSSNFTSQWLLFFTHSEILVIDLWYNFASSFNIMWRRWLGKNYLFHVSRSCGGKDKISDAILNVYIWHNRPRILCDTSFLINLGTLISLELFFRRLGPKGSYLTLVRVADRRRFLRFHMSFWFQIRVIFLNCGLPNTLYIKSVKFEFKIFH